MATSNFTNWRPPSGGFTLAAPGFADQWAYDDAAAVNPGANTPQLGSMLNWSLIPGLSNNVFKDMGPDSFGDLPTVDNAAMDAWLTKNGYKIRDSGQVDGKVGYRWVEDRNGNVIGQPSAYDNDDSTFMTGAALAAAIAGGGILAAQSGAGGAAAAGSGTAATSGSAAGGAGAAAASSTPLNMAAIEAGLGTAGYGTNAAAAASGLFNPATIGAGAAGSLGAAEALGSGELLSGMDLAADAALGSGNNIITAGSSLPTTGALNSVASELATNPPTTSATGAATPGGTTAPGYSAAGNYGPGMTGAQTGVFDAVLGATGSTAAAAAASASPLVSGALSTVGDLVSGASSGLATGAKTWFEKLTGGGQGTLEGIQDLLKLYGLYNSLESGGGGGGSGSPLASIAQLKAQVGDPNGTWNEAQKAAAQKYFTAPLTKYTPPPASRFGVDPMNPVYPKYARGGDVAPLNRIATDVRAATHVGPGYVASGPGGGQDDLVDARLSPGEYVFDAELVSALGDGSNEEGARRLDAMRQRVRAHKRSGPLSQIAPRARTPEAYFKKGA